MKDYSSYHPSYKTIIKDSGELIFDCQLLEEGEEVLIYELSSGKSITANAIVHEQGAPLDEFQEVRRIMCKNEFPIQRGDYIKTLKDNRVFLVLTEIDSNMVYQTAKVIECNNVVRWHINRETIYEVPCILGDKTSVYSDGITHIRQTLIPDDQMMIIIPSNALTDTLRLNYRIMFNKDPDWVYTVTRTDKLTQTGLTTMRMKRDTYNDNKDDATLGVAEYKKDGFKIETEGVSATGYSIVLSGVDKLRADQIAEYEAKVYLDGLQVDNIQASFSLDISKAGLAKIVSTADNKVLVQGNIDNILGYATLKACLVDYPTIGEEFAIKIAGLF